MNIPLPSEFSKYDEASATIVDIEPMKSPFRGVCRSRLEINVHRNGIGYQIVHFLPGKADGYEMGRIDTDYFIGKADKFFSGFK